MTAKIIGHVITCKAPCCTAEFRSFASASVLVDQLRMAGWVHRASVSRGGIRSEHYQCPKHALPAPRTPSVQIGFHTGWIPTGGSGRFQ